MDNFLKTTPSNNDVLLLVWEQCLPTALSSLYRNPALTSLFFTSAGAALVWNWWCGAPQRTLSPRGWRTLYKDSSASSWQWTDRLPPLYHLSAVPHPSPRSQQPMNRRSAPCSAALRSSTLERKTWSYRGKSMSTLSDPVCEISFELHQCKWGITIRGREGKHFTMLSWNLSCAIFFFLFVSTCTFFVGGTIFALDEMRSILCECGQWFLFFPAVQWQINIHSVCCR